MDGTAPALSVQRPETPEQAQEAARYRLGEQATAFRTLYQRLRESMAEHPTGESTSVIFDRAARRVCKGCAMEGSCWKWDHHDTYDDLSAALKAMQERGSGEARDYPERFRHKCLRFDAFRTAANEELFAFWTRRQYRMRLRESRIAVCRQYAQLARLLEDAAAELDEELRFECTGSAAADRALDRLGVRGEAGLWLDGRGRRVLTVTGRQLEALKTQEGLRELRSALGVPVELWESTPVRSGVRLTFRQTPPLAATVGVAVRKKEGQAVSGDSGSWFKDEQGNLWVTVCDGMGSGEAASRESSLVLHLVEDFIHAGVEPEAALTTLTGALSLRGEIDGGFTTVDLLHIDLFTGAGELYKLGGAPSYLRRRGSVSRVSGTALPAGLELEGENRPDVTHFRLGGRGLRPPPQRRRHRRHRGLVAPHPDGALGGGQSPAAGGGHPEKSPDKDDGRLHRGGGAAESADGMKMKWGCPQKTTPQNKKPGWIAAQSTQVSLVTSEANRID